MTKRVVSCKVCGTEFEPHYPNVKLCSAACRKISNHQSREHWRSKTPDNKSRWAGYSKAYRQRNPIKSKLTFLRIRAEKLEVPFDLDEQWLEENSHSSCPVLGIPLDSSSRDNTPSVDRLFPEKGYTKENCVVMSMKANRLKSDASIEDIEKILQFMKNKA